jgi:hypothetical protein
MNAGDCDNPGKIPLRKGRWYLARRQKGRVVLLVDNPKLGYAPADAATSAMTKLKLHGADMSSVIIVMAEEDWPKREPLSSGDRDALLREGNDLT